MYTLPTHRARYLPTGQGTYTPGGYLHTRRVPTPGGYNQGIPQGCTTRVYHRVYYQGIPQGVLPGYTPPSQVHPCTLSRPSSACRTHSSLLSGKRRSPGLRKGRSPWAGGEERVKVVNPVGREGQLCAELLRSSQGRTDNDRIDEGCIPI